MSYPTFTDVLKGRLLVICLILPLAPAWFLVTWCVGRDMLGRWPTFDETTWVFNETVATFWRGEE